MTDPELKELLEANLAVSKENNVLLKKAHKIQKRAQTWKLIYWIVVFGAVFGVYYYIQPYFERVTSLFGNTKAQLEKISNLSNALTDVKNVNKIIDQVKSK